MVLYHPSAKLSPYSARLQLAELLQKPATFGTVLKHTAFLFMGTVQPVNRYSGEPRDWQDFEGENEVL